MQLARTMIREPMLAGLAVAIGVLGAPLALHAQQTPAPAPPPSKVCADCDTSGDAQVERQLEAARAEVDRARQALLDALQQTANARDTIGMNTEALARAEGELRRAQERYQRFTSQLLRRRLERATVSAEDAMREMRTPQALLPSGWLGVTFSASNHEVEHSGDKVLMRFDDYPTIESVEPDSPAERAGLQAGDKLLALNGKDVTKGCEPLPSLLKPGSHLGLRVKRGRYTKDLTALIQKRPNSDWTFSWRMETPPAAVVPATPLPPNVPTPPASDVRVFVTPMPPMPAPMAEGSGRGMSIGGEVSVVAGAQVRPVGSLGDYFGVREGVLVLHVVPGSVADRSGLRDGDVILSADGRSITTPGSLSRSIYRASDAQQLKLDIVRLKKRRTVLLKWDTR